MSTIVFVHAHPDDEASQTSGSMTRLSAEGHRVVVVYGTGGDHGTIPDGHDGDLAELRRAEAAASAEVTGAQRLVWLDHLDSGMTGWDTNGHPDAFMNADVATVARTIADVLDAEDADVVVGYEAGYRVSWESAVNYVGQELFSDNTRMWSGDHAFTRDQVPGIFFCNRKIREKDPGLIDISPTVLAAFGIDKPAFVDGRDLGLG